MRILAFQRLFTGLTVLVLTSIQAIATPNILLIIADDMGLDASPCHQVGKYAPNMPVLAGLCDQGMVFDNAYTPPSCSPTRASILTGKYSFRTGIGSALSAKRNPGSLSTSETSIFDVFNSALPAYKTAVIGKWHVSSDKRDFNHPAKMGVKEYFGNYSGIVRDYYHWRTIENGRPYKIDGYSTTVLTDRAVNWVNRQKQPWFLWLAYNAPHVPFHAPPANLHTYSDIRYGVKPKGSEQLRYYFAALQAMDTEIGRLLNSMAPDVRKNTVVIFIGDNGTPNKVVDAVYAHRGAKTTIWEGGINVPLIISGPGVSRGRSRALVNSTDLFATILGLAGAKVNQPDSRNLNSALRGGSSGRDVVFIEHFSKNKKLKGALFGWIIRDARYKLLHKANGSEMLFDLKNDPFERIDLLSKSPTSTTVNIQKRLQAAHSEILNSP